MAKAKDYVNEDKYPEVALPDFNAVQKTTADNGDIGYILIPKKERPKCCEACGSIAMYVHKHNTRKVKDLDSFGCRVGHIILFDSYRCDDCSALFIPEFRSLSGRMTTRLVEAIQNEAIQGVTHSVIANKYHVSETTVSNRFEEAARPRMDAYRVIMPPVLGIDEVHLEDDYRGVFVKVDRESGRVIEFTQKRTTASVKETLQSMEQPENLQVVTMDMWNPYKIAVNAVFPNVPIVIDHFHVIKNLLRAMDSRRAAICKAITGDKERKSLKHNRYLLLTSSEDLSAKQAKALREILKEYSELETLYTLKEAFRDIYKEAKDAKDGVARFNEWVDACTQANVTAYDVFIETVRNWQGEIFAYFDYPTLKPTNAQTESFNRVIRDLARQGRGYSFDTLREKVLLRRYSPEVREQFSFDFILEALEELD